MLKELKELTKLYNQTARGDKHVETPPQQEQPEKTEVEKQKPVSREIMLFAIAEQMKQNRIEQKEIDSLQNRTDDELLYLYKFWNENN